MNVPINLSHKPIIAVNNYDQIDNPNGQSDAKALSLGEAQYNPNDISAKVFRHNDITNRWSAQSEELPLHRVLDLSILILNRTLIAQGKNDPNYPNNPILGNIQEISPNDIAKLDTYLQNYQELYPRIDEIKRLIALF